LPVSGVKKEVFVGYFEVETIAMLWEFVREYSDRADYLWEMSNVISPADIHCKPAFLNLQYVFQIDFRVRRRRLQQFVPREEDI
jgi:hypothetical protein